MDKRPDIQYLPAEEIKLFQDEKLRETISYLYAHSPYYGRMFREAGIDPSSIRRTEDLAGIPVTTKKDIHSHGDDFICVDRKKIVDYVTTSGTLGDPVTIAVTGRDLDRLAYNEALSFSTAGCLPGDILQLMVTIDRRFMAGLAYFLGAREGGFSAVRVGNGIPELQWDTIERIKPTAAVVIPSFLMKLADYAQSHGIDHRGSSLRRAICIGESLRNDDFTPSRLGTRITEKWPGLALHSTYASTEMQTSFTECSHLRGGHLQPELIIVEMLDENDQPVPPGQPGEVTVTTLGVEGTPLLRFKTGDICRMHTEPCPCGRGTVRLGPVIGRRDQMIKYKGTTLYPPAIFDVLDSVPGITNYIVEIFTGELGTDQIRVRLSSTDLSDDFLKHLKDLFRSRIRVAPELELVDEKQILQMHDPMYRKPKKLVYL